MEGDYQLLLFFKLLFLWCVIELKYVVQNAIKRHMLPTACRASSAVGDQKDRHDIPEK